VDCPKKDIGYRQFQQFYLAVKTNLKVHFVFKKAEIDHKGLWPIKSIFKLKDKNPADGDGTEYCR